MQKTTELKIVLIATMGLLSLATAEGVVSNQHFSTRLNGAERALNISVSIIDMVAKQRDWLLKLNNLLGQQRDIKTDSAAKAINLLNRIPAAVKTNEAIKPHYEAAKVAVNGNRSLLEKMDNEFAELESHRPD